MKLNFRSTLIGFVVGAMLIIPTYFMTKNTHEQRYAYVNIDAVMDFVTSEVKDDPNTSKAKINYYRKLFDLYLKSYSESNHAIVFFISKSYSWSC